MVFPLYLLDTHHCYEISILRVGHVELFHGFLHHFSGQTVKALCRIGVFMPGHPRDGRHVLTLGQPVVDEGLPDVVGEQQAGFQGAFLNQD